MAIETQKLIRNCDFAVFLTVLWILLSSCSISESVSWGIEKEISNHHTDRQNDYYSEEKNIIIISITLHHDVVQLIVYHRSS